MEEPPSSEGRYNEGDETEGKRTKDRRKRVCCRVFKNIKYPRRRRILRQSCEVKSTKGWKEGGEAKEAKRLERERERESNRGGR